VSHATASLAWMSKVPKGLGMLFVEHHSHKRDLIGSRFGTRKLRWWRLILGTAKSDTKINPITFHGVGECWMKLYQHHD